MRQFRITTENLNTVSDDDAYLDPSDPIHELKATAVMDGLGGQDRLAAYKAKLRIPVVGSNKGQIQRELNIKPGTEEWFQLWFGKGAVK